MAEVPLATLKAWIETLQAAIAQGVTQVRFGDQTIVYADPADMQKRLDRMEREYTVRTGGVPRPLARHSVFRRG